ncbi:hypothetical protein E7744_09395 [Citricoccus sp. SGAir0253]|uniref:hypothetical protein n=1 Tax=Citricoccus sp. SGAir0253 TaxID=2567881 RepID=UPI0010CD0E82|nr:hypothetical protein [Citricoccus sp. SGAir0253]QCU78355.1 hypothetical protein E7744_09395 [Citricoccus sp. SGAir0253]
MRIVLFDGIQEAHVGSSLERALVAAGHEVYNTGRFGKGFLFRDTDDFLATVRPHLDRIAAFRPDWVLVFRPGSAPLPVLRELRGTGAALAVWFSDDPVPFELSYGPAVDLYDLVLHCGNERVLRFYEERFGRPTGVNFPFWTDHEAFPAVYGRQEPDTTALFLGNVAGPVRRGRYDLLAGMRHPVRIFGQAGEDPAGLGGGFLDTDAEVVRAGSRARVALNIPQFFRDHRGLRTWFPGLEGLGFFDLPSRVVQYAAMGLPTISVVPGESRVPAFPELVVCESVGAADEWIAEALRDGRLPGLGERVLDRFDRSFSAAARVLALESLMTDDGWRSLDAAERAVWFLGFDGTAAPGGGVPGGGAGTGRDRAGAGPVSVTGGTTTPTEPADRADRAADPAVDPADLAGVVVLHGRVPARFSPLDAVLRDLCDAGVPPVVLGPEELPGIVAPAPAGSPFATVLDTAALLERLGTATPRIVLLSEGVGLAPEGAAALREAGIASVYLLHGEPLVRDGTAVFDLVVGVGPTSVERGSLLRAADNAVHSPGLVDTAFLTAVRERTARTGRPGATAVRTGENALADWVLGSFPGPRRDVSPEDLAAADPDGLADLLARPVVYLQPSVNGRRRAHLPVTAYAVCASPAVVTTRHPPGSQQDPFGDWLVRAESPAEAARKLGWLGAAAGPAGTAAVLAARHEALGARPQLAAWFRRAVDAARGVRGRPGADGVRLADGTDHAVRLDHRYALDTRHVATGHDRSLRIRLAFAHPGLVAGLGIGQAGVTVAETRFPAGTADAVDVTVAGVVDPERGPLCVEVLGDPLHRSPGPARVRVATRIEDGPGVAGGPGNAVGGPAGETVDDGEGAGSPGWTAYLMPRSRAAAEHGR